MGLSSFLVKYCVPGALGGKRANRKKPRTTGKRAGKGKQIADVKEEAWEEESEDEDDDAYEEEDRPLVRLPLLCRDTPIDALVDSGCTSLVIAPELVKILGAKRHRLPKPQKVEQALKKEIHTHVVTEYVRIEFHHCQFDWRSGLLRYKIAPVKGGGLILGLPFFDKHTLSLSTSPKSSLMNKRTGFDLITGEGLPRRRHAGDETSDRRKIEVAILERIKTLEDDEAMRGVERALQREFDDRFPPDLPDMGPAPPNIPQDSLDSMRIRLKNPEIEFKTRVYSCPQKVLPGFKMLIEQHLRAGRIRISTSHVASPAFVVPKRDPTALPRMAIDYCKLNAGAIRDRTPLPNIDEILAKAGQAQYWGKIDMTNSFFQTRVHPDDIHLTAFTTPFGMFEWVVMPMGWCNSLAIHQRRMYKALGKLIGVSCFVYMDDIIVYSPDLRTHEENCRAVLEALRENDLYASTKKTELVSTGVEFCGHVISRCGVEADPSKIAKIQEWLTPRSTKDLRSFLGLTQYLRKFLEKLASLTAVLMPLTTKEAEKNFRWEGRRAPQKRLQCRHDESPYSPRKS